MGVTCFDCLSANHCLNDLLTILKGDTLFFQLTSRMWECQTYTILIADIIWRSIPLGFTARYTDMMDTNFGFKGKSYFAGSSFKEFGSLSFDAPGHTEALALLSMFWTQLTRTFKLPELFSLCICCICLSPLREHVVDFVSISARKRFVSPSHY